MFGRIPLVSGFHGVLPTGIIISVIIAPTKRHHRYPCSFINQFADDHIGCLRLFSTAKLVTGLRHRSCSSDCVQANFCFIFLSLHLQSTNFPVPPPLKDSQQIPPDGVLLLRFVRYNCLFYLVYSNNSSRSAVPKLLCTTAYTKN